PAVRPRRSSALAAGDDGIPSVWVSPIESAPDRVVRWAGPQFGSPVHRVPLGTLRTSEGRSYGPPGVLATVAGGGHRPVSSRPGSRTSSNDVRPSRMRTVLPARPATARRGRDRGGGRGTRPGTER